MKLRLLCTFYFFSIFFAPSIHGESREFSSKSLSDQARISLVTQWPGSEIYYAFGHSAVRVFDEGSGIDELYNYGVFSLEDPLFLARFAYGELDYLLGIYPYKADLKYDAVKQNRKWHEQVLNLDPDQVRSLYQFLSNNALPANRVYRYDIILDNCSTRIRDVFEKVLGNSVRFSKTDPNSEGKTYRNMIDEYVGTRPFWQFLIYLVIGSEVDKKVDAYHAMWLPHYLMWAFDTGTVKKGEQFIPLVKSQKPVLTPQQPSDYADLQSNPAFVLWPLAALIVLVSIWLLFLRKKKKYPQKQKIVFRIGDWLLYLAVGVVGVVVAYLTFISTHTLCKGNFNVVWLWPTHLIIAFFILFNIRFRWVRWYFLAATVASILPVLLWPVWPQGMHPTMIAPMLILSVRSYAHFVRLRPLA